MSKEFKNFQKGIALIPGSNVSALKGELSVDTSGLLNYHNGTSSSQVITASHSATLTNKSIDLTDNTLTGTSAELAAAISDETGTGFLVFNNTPSLTTPQINEAVNLTSTSTKLNYLTSAIGTTGNAATNVVFSGSSGNGPTITDLTVNKIYGFNTESFAIFGGSNQDVSITSSGTGKVYANNIIFDGVYLRTDSSSLPLAAASIIEFFPVYPGNPSVANFTSTGLSIVSGKTIKFYDSDDSNYIQIKAPSIVTPSNYTITLPAAQPGANTALVFDGTNYIWSSAGGWYSSTSLSLTNGGEISISTTQGQQAVEVQSSSGAIALSNTPFGSSAPSDKVVIRLIGRSNTDTVQINNYNGAKGCLLNGNAILGLGDVLEVMYVSSIDKYIETFRNF